MNPLPYLKLIHLLSAFFLIESICELVTSIFKVSKNEYWFAYNLLTSSISLKELLTYELCLQFLLFLQDRDKRHTYLP